MQEKCFPFCMGYAIMRLSISGRNPVNWCLCVLAVIASQRAGFSGNPPVREKMYRQLPYRSGNAAIFGGNRYLVPFNRGIATPVCELARNDSISL